MKKFLIIILLMMSISCVNENIDNTINITPETTKSTRYTFDTSPLTPVLEFKEKLGITRTFTSLHKNPVGIVCGTDTLVKHRGTGTLISHDLFLTNKHVLNTILDEDGQLSRHAGVFFGYETYKPEYDYMSYEYNQEGDPEFFKFTEIIEVGITAKEYEHSGLYAPDYAILRFEGSPGLKYGWADLSDSVPEIGNTVVAIQHPGSHDYNTTSVKQVDVGVITEMPMIFDDIYIRYDLISVLGSSGSSVYDENGDLIALLFATRKSVLISTLLKYSPTLNNLLNEDPYINLDLIYSEDIINVLSKKRYINIDNIDIHQLNRCKALTFKNIDSLDLTGIENIYDLRYLFLLNINLGTLPDLSIIQDLRSLGCRNCNLTDISSVSNLNKLVIFNMTNNQVEDISYVFDLPKLSRLYVNRNPLNQQSLILLDENRDNFSYIDIYQ